jgi:hypothetical protein
MEEDPLLILHAASILKYLVAWLGRNECSAERQDASSLLISPRP